MNNNQSIKFRTNFDNNYVELEDIEIKFKDDRIFNINPQIKKYKFIYNLEKSEVYVLHSNAIAGPQEFYYVLKNIKGVRIEQKKKVID